MPHTPSSPVAEQLRRTVDEIKTLADEVRLDIHLGTMELKDKWSKIEPRVWRVEQVSRESALELLGALRSLRDSLKKKPSA